MCCFQDIYVIFEATPQESMMKNKDQKLGKIMEPLSLIGDRLVWHSPILQTQQTKIHRATR